MSEPYTPTAHTRVTREPHRGVYDRAAAPVPMVCFVNVESGDRIIYSIFQRFNLEWNTRTLSVFAQAA